MESQSCPPSNLGDISKGHRPGHIQMPLVVEAHALYRIQIGDGSRPLLTGTKHKGGASNRHTSALLPKQAGSAPTPDTGLVTWNGQAWY